MRNVYAPALGRDQHATGNDIIYIADIHEGDILGHEYRMASRCPGPSYEVLVAASPQDELPPIRAHLRNAITLACQVSHPA